MDSLPSRLRLQIAGEQHNGLGIAEFPCAVSCRDGLSHLQLAWAWPEQSYGSIDPAQRFPTELLPVAAAVLLGLLARFGDYDPSGTKIDPAIERSIRRILMEEFRWDEGLAGLPTFERVAVTEEQIAGTLGEPLPTRPTKIKDNKHAKGWAEDQESVELDAIPAGQLRQLVRDTIEQHVDHDQLDKLRRIEAEERKQLEIFGKKLKK